MSSIQIPLLKPDSLHAQVEIYPDELPQETTEIMDPLVAEYAPLQIWKAVAVRQSIFAPDCAQPFFIQKYSNFFF